MMRWQWHQLDHTQIIYTSFQTDNHASTSPLRSYRLDALPAVQPTEQRQSTEAIYLQLENERESSHVIGNFVACQIIMYH